jgi:cysteine-rich repeat protein
VCTQDLLISSGTCQANCQNPVITTPDGGVDGCCPASGNNNNDSDCPVECGNSAVETTETCDDGNTDPGDGCDENCQVEIGPTAYRIDSLLLRDPHAFTQVFFFCPDITGQLNDEFAAAITTDDDGDNLLDLSIVQVFRPLDQSAASTPAEAHFPDCTAPMSSTSCTSTGNGISLTATNQSSGTCLSPLANTTGGYSPAITNSTSPCFADNATDLDIDVGGLIITLRSARVAATYVGNPAGTLVNGLIAGFLTETDADNTFIPDDIAVVGGEPLSSVLPGGAGNCSSNDDRDTGPGGESGWWIYLNFQATQVPWTD